MKLIAVVELLPGVLESQLRRDSDLSHFEYFVLAMLSEAPEHALRMTTLSERVNATLPRLSHVVQRLKGRGLVERFPSPEKGSPKRGGMPKGYKKTPEKLVAGASGRARPASCVHTEIP